MPRCKLCKDKFTPKQFNQKHCFEKKECITAEIELKKSQAWKKKKKVMQKELKTKQDYEKVLQVIFNKFIRLRDKDKPCISCPRPLIDKFDAGHFYPVGSYKNLRFNEMNVHGQCVHCNQHKHGNLIEYQKGLIKRIGQDKVDELDAIRNEPAHFTIPELEELIKEYKNKLK